MADSNAVFIGVGRIADQLILASVSGRLTTQEKLDIESTFRKLLADDLSRAGPGNRDKKSFTGGVLYTLVDRESYCVHGLCVKSKSYPERVAFACLNESVTMITQSDEQQLLRTAQKPNSLTRHFRKGLKELMDKYDNPANVDKVADVTIKVNHVKGIMQENIDKVISTHANIQELEQKTDDLNTNAKSFERRANDLSRAMWWQKTKVTIMIGVVVAAIVIYIVVLIIKSLGVA